MVLVGLGRVLGGTLGGALGVCDGSGVSRVGPLGRSGVPWGALGGALGAPKGL